MSATEALESKSDFIGRFMVSSGGTLSNGEPVTSIALYLSVVGDHPFVSLTFHIESAEAIQIGKALMEHGERMVKL